MWALMAAPLIIGSDPRTLPAEMIAALANPEIVAVDQDRLAVQGVKVADPTATTQIWSKTLSGTGRRAVALLNRGDTAQHITVNFADVALGGAVRIRDLWARADAGTFTDAYTATVPAHGVAMLGLSGADEVAGEDLGGPNLDGPGLGGPGLDGPDLDGPDLDGLATASPAVAHDTVFARGADGTLQANSGAGWQGLGKRILGQPAAYGSASGRIDIFVRGTDNAVWRRAYAGGRWGSWTSLGGHVTDAPTVAFTGPAAWTVFARGADGLIWSRTERGAWTSIGAPDGRPTYGRPSAVADEAGAVHVAVRTRTDEVWERVRTGGVWSEWTSLGGTVSGSPTLLATSGRIYMFVLAADNRLWQRNYVDGGWGGWFRRGEFSTGAFQGAVGAAPGANGSAVVAVRGTDNHIHRLSL